MNLTFPTDMLSFFLPLRNLSKPASDVYVPTFPGRKTGCQNDGLFLPEKFTTRGLAIFLGLLVGLQMLFVVDH